MPPASYADCRLYRLINDNIILCSRFFIVIKIQGFLSTLVAFSELFSTYIMCPYISPASYADCCLYRHITKLSHHLSSYRIILTLLIRFTLSLYKNLSTVIDYHIDLAKGGSLFQISKALLFSLSVVMRIYLVSCKDVIVEYFCWQHSAKNTTVNSHCVERKNPSGKTTRQAELYYSDDWSKYK